MHLEFYKKKYGHACDCSTLMCHWQILKSEDSNCAQTREVTKKAIPV